MPILPPAAGVSRTALTRAGEAGPAGVGRRGAVADGGP
ncbi:hypothetical protein LY71_11628 [Geodermatophilus tzadiensis]|uniref:Uncharacterized protein n=1 Tax=Geodermatophilus tzadiensis TaxID=1137988 RepID=A0A2T0TFB6_9ACTN|nr:hypothetical protein LY71_11628 [Geodermatophilus tzadiensis]